MSRGKNYCGACLYRPEHGSGYDALEWCMHASLFETKVLKPWFSEEESPVRKYQGVSGLTKNSMAYRNKNNNCKDFHPG